MQRSYLVKSPVHFADFGFFVKVGDILVHDTSNSNRLTVYRNGEVVKAVKQTTLGLAAMQKSGFIEEVTQQAAKAASKPALKPVEAPKPILKREEPKPAPVKKPEEPKPVPTKKPEEPKLTSVKKPEPKPSEEIEDETV
jgi:outer membrane biosynthesis protein TonB